MKEAKKKEETKTEVQAERVEKRETRRKGGK